MNKLAMGTIASIALTLSALVHAAADTSTASEQALRSKQMDECFQAHAQLMDKRPLKTE